MIEDQTTLITILNEVINSNKIKINSSSSIKEKYFKELNLLKDNINNISIIKLTIIRNILDELDISYKEKEDIYKDIINIRELISLNENAHTTYKISNKQIITINKLINYMENNNITYNEEEIKAIKEKNNKYILMLEKIENPNNKDYLDDITTINILLDECNIDWKTKKGILFNIMRYNANCYNSK